MTEYLIKNGYIVDGTGAPWFKADLIISGSKIKNLGHNIPSSTAETVIDANGLVVCPGFIDTHGHSELHFLAYPYAESKIMQGITTEFACQCGTSGTGPLIGSALGEIQDRIEKSSLNLEINWRTLSEYMEHFTKKGCSMNGAFQAGHNTLRLCVMGWENRAPTEEEMEEMKKLLDQTMKEGAFGLSTGLMYPPGSFAETEEVIELCKVIKKYGGIHTSHIRRYGFNNEPRGGRDFIIRLIDSQFWAIKECIRIGEEADVPTTWSHAKAMGKINWGEPLKRWLSEVEFARRNGIDVSIDSYPWTYRGSLVRGIPTWAYEGGPLKLRERLIDPEIGKRIREILDRNMSSIVAEHTWDRALITDTSEGDKDLIGLTISQAAKKRNMEPVDLYLDRLLNDKPLQGHGQAMSEEDVKTILKYPQTMVSTDGYAMPKEAPIKAHPRSFGTYPKILRKYVREERLLGLEEAIRKMTSMPATRLGLMDRGILRSGFFADVVIFDPLNVREATTFMDPMRYPEGIDYVFVNGKLTVVNGEHTGELAGIPLKKHKK